jgi:hypothetical protein
MALSEYIVVPCTLFGLVFAFFQYTFIKAIPVAAVSEKNGSPVLNQDPGETPESRVPDI